MEKPNSATTGSDQKTEGDLPNVEERLKGVLLGAACANSLGGSAVGLNHKEILATAGAALRDFAPGLSRSLFPDHQPGRWLADTHLAVVFAESLIDNKGQFSGTDLKQRYSALLEDKDFLASGPGAHSLALLRRLADGGRPQKEDKDATHVSSAARAFSAGCLPTSSKAADIAIEQAMLTQLDTRVHAAAAVIADSVQFFVAGNRIDTEDKVREYVKREFALAEKVDARFAEAWDDVAPDLDYVNPANELPYSLLNIGSDAGELVPTAVGIFLIFRHNLEEAVCAAAVAGGDTDRLAIIVGAISGAYHGVNAIPERWLSKISERERLEKVARGFAALWSN